MTTEDLSYYSTNGTITDPGEFAPLLDSLPSDMPSVARTVQGVLTHVHWATQTGADVSPERKEELQLRHVRKILARALELNEAPLSDARPIAERVIGNCRDFTTLACSILRQHGVPARARCGFGAYFDPAMFIDHWLVEYWHPERQSWRFADAQIDEFQRGVLKPSFDLMDVPRDQFIVAGQAWNECRSGRSDPQKYGIFDMRGLWFIRGNILRDLAALNKVELLPWDLWALSERTDDELSEDDIAVIDRAAALTAAAHRESNEERRKLYESDDRFRVPAVIRSMTETGPRHVTLEP